MINCIAYDVEVLRNFFSITFVSINSYLKVFKDCVNADNKPIPLVQKLSVEEIKARLETVEKHSFYITYTDDSQLLSMIDYINKTRCYKDSNGTIIRTDLYGFNNFNYDNLMIAALLSFYMRTNSTKRPCPRRHGRCRCRSGCMARLRSRRRRGSARPRRGGSANRPTRPRSSARWRWRGRCPR